MDFYNFSRHRFRRLYERCKRRDLCRLSVNGRPLHCRNFADFRFDRISPGGLGVERDPTRVGPSFFGQRFFGQLFFRFGIRSHHALAFAPWHFLYLRPLPASAWSHFVQPLAVRATDRRLAERDDGARDHRDVRAILHLRSTKFDSGHRGGTQQLHDVQLRVRVNLYFALNSTTPLESVACPCLVPMISRPAHFDFVAPTRAHRLRQILFRFSGASVDLMYGMFA